MSRKPVTTDQRQHIAVLSANNQSLNSMARQTGLHPATCKRIAAEPQTLEMVETAGKYLAEKMLKRADQIIDAISDEDIFKAGLRDKTVAAGVLQDKARQSYGLDKPASLININLDLSPVDLSKWSNR